MRSEPRQGALPEEAHPPGLLLAGSDAICSSRKRRRSLLSPPPRNWAHADSERRGTRKRVWNPAAYACVCSFPFAHARGLPFYSGAEVADKERGPGVAVSL